MNEEKPRLFLSYAHEDIGMAKKIYDDLKRYDLDVCLDIDLISAGQQWKDAIENPLKQSNYVIALLSAGTISETDFSQREMKIAFDILGQNSAGDIHVIPVRLDECNPSHISRLNGLRAIDLFPESEYRHALKKILYIVNPTTFSLRHKPIQLSEADVNSTIKLHDFFDKHLNPDGRGFNHQYKQFIVKENSVIVDEKSNLMWQKGGSARELIFAHAMEWINQVNQREYAGFRDWRLPTMDEAMTLMEPEQKNGYLYIDAVFNSKQTWIWTADQLIGDSRRWAIHFIFGRCNFSPMDVKLYVRAVRLVDPSKN